MGARFFWDAFWELSTERASGSYGEGRIPYSAIRDFALDHGIADSGSFRFFRTMIRAMDAEYLDRGKTTASLEQQQKEAGLSDIASVNDPTAVRGLLSRISKARPDTGEQ